MQKIRPENSGRIYYHLVQLLPGQHVLEQLHVLASGNVPAEVLLHLVLLQSTEAFPIVVVQIQGALHLPEL